MKPSHWLILALPLAAGCHPNRTASDGSGTIECTQVQVAPQVAGRIQSLPPQEGDALKRGTVVAQLDPADFELRKAEAEAALAQAQAQLELLQAGSREEDVQRARAQLREAEANAWAAAADRGRIEQVSTKRARPGNSGTTRGPPRTGPKP